MDSIPCLESLLDYPPGNSKNQCSNVEIDVKHFDAATSKRTTTSNALLKFSAILSAVILWAGLSVLHGEHRNKYSMQHEGKNVNYIKEMSKYLKSFIFSLAR